MAQKRYKPLLDFAELTWTPRKGRKSVFVVLDEGPVSVLTDEHFNLIQSNASGFGQLFEWFPPRTDPSGDEGRLLVRAGVQLKFALQKIGVYIREVSKYN